MQTADMGTSENLWIPPNPRHAGTIHDDAKAQELGYEAGFVPGHTVGQFAFREVVAAFGKTWFEGGWYDFRLVSPVYPHTPVQTRSDRDGDGTLAVEVVANGERTCLTGRAGLGTDLGPSGPWDPALDRTREPDRVMAAFEIGHEFGTERVVTTAEAMEEPVAASNDPNAWFKDASPWGPGVIAPEYVMGISLEMSSDEIHANEDPEEIGSPLMWAEHAIVQFSPLFLGVPYTYRTVVVDKGLHTRTLFLTSETTVQDDDGSQPVVLRQTIKWLRRDV